MAAPSLSLGFLDRLRGKSSWPRRRAALRGNSLSIANLLTERLGRPTDVKLCSHPTGAPAAKAYGGFPRRAAVLGDSRQRCRAASILLFRGKGTILFTPNRLRIRISTPMQGLVSQPKGVRGAASVPAPSGDRMRSYCPPAGMIAQAFRPTENASLLSRSAAVTRRSGSATGTGGACDS